MSETTTPVTDKPLMEQDVWLFAYGSLIWRADFHYDEKHPAIISGWERRFWQGSCDHRGTPDSPGRVVTLMAAPEGQCQGAAYLLSSSSKAKVLKALDHREKGGYQRLEIDIDLNPALPASSAANHAKIISGVTYIATPENPNFLGQATVPEMATQILYASGPSGHNTEYLFELEKTLLEMGVVDEHVEVLAREVRKQSARRN